MKLSARIFLAYFLIVGLGVVWFVNSLNEQLRPAIRQSSEEALVDTANLLAELAADDLAGGFMTIGPFSDAVEAYLARRFNADIWSFEKAQPDFTIYVTNKSGVIVFHTNTDELGKDYSRWIDVKRTLEGNYGARTTRTDPNDELSSSMYVAAPVIFKGDLIGVLTVGQPNASIQPFLEFAKNKIWQQGIWILAAALGLGILMALWLTRSIAKLVEYVEDVRIGLRAVPPKLREKELAHLASSIDSMRQEIEGKEYIEHYIQTLTHEMKSPLAAIRGATELMQEGNMAVEEQQHFLNNIHAESNRMRQFIDRLLSLAAVEKRNELDKPEIIDLVKLVQQELNSKQSICQQKNLQVRFNAETETANTKGEHFLLQQALSNLLDNAIDFSPTGGELSITIEQQDNENHIRINNQGEPIPDYAKHRIFERFYSLPRPESGRKSSGLGLSFVKEVAMLHKGEIKLSNTSNGVEAKLMTPQS